jgi:hypothetical protein
MDGRRNDFAIILNKLHYNSNGVVHVDKIEILADSRKIASVVDILYYDPT